MRYAIIASGGRQYVAREGEVLEIDRLDRPVGEAFAFEEVLLAADGDQVLVGSPLVAGAKVMATVQGEVRGKKLVVFRYQPKKRRRRKLGHRQAYTRVAIDQIDLPGVGRSAAAAPAKKSAPRKKATGAKTKRAGATKAAPRKGTAKKKKD